MGDVVRSLHSDMGVNSLIFTITESTPTLVDADRCTLYLVDKSHKELWSMQGAVEIRCPMDKGLAGHTAVNNVILNILDAHDDSRFNQAFDDKTGYRTKSMLVMPIHSKKSSGDVIGVLQLINKVHGTRFTSEDEDVLRSFLDIAGAILETSQLFQNTREKLSEFQKATQVQVTKSKPSPGMEMCVGCGLCGRDTHIRNVMCPLWGHGQWASGDN